MSTFGGLMEEYRRVSLDRFDGINLQSTVYMLSHNHKDHTVGLDSTAFRYRLCSNSAYKLYCSSVTRDLLLLVPAYSPIKNSIVGLSIDVPHVIPIPDQFGNQTGAEVIVTLLQAGHCPGSVMFLFDGCEGRALYTGDFRLTRQDLLSFDCLKDLRGVRDVQSVYVDTTFCVPDAAYIPQRDESAEAAITVIQDWMDLEGPQGVVKGPQHVVLLRYRADIGYENLFARISQHFNMKIHVDEAKFKQYECLGKMADYVTLDPSVTRIHACRSQQRHFHRHSTDGANNKRGSYLPCGYSGPNSSSPLEVRTILFSTMAFLQRVRLDSYVRKINRRFFRICYSFHPSYCEVRDLILYLRPARAYPNVIPAYEHAGCTMQERLNGFVKLAQQIKSGRQALEEDDPDFRSLGKLKPAKTKKRYSDDGKDCSYSKRRRNSSSNSPCAHRDVDGAKPQCNISPSKFRLLFGGTESSEHDESLGVSASLSRMVEEISEEEKKAFAQEINSEKKVFAISDISRGDDKVNDDDNESSEDDNDDDDDDDNIFSSGQLTSSSSSSDDEDPSMNGNSQQNFYFPHTVLLGASQEVCCSHSAEVPPVAFLPDPNALTTLQSSSLQLGNAVMLSETKCDVALNFNVTSLSVCKESCVNVMPQLDVTMCNATAVPQGCVKQCESIAADVAFSSVKTESCTHITEKRRSAELNPIVLNGMSTGDIYSKCIHSTSNHMLEVPSQQRSSAFYENKEENRVKSCEKLADIGLERSFESDKCLELTVVPTECIGDEVKVCQVSSGEHAVNKSSSGSLANKSPIVRDVSAVNLEKPLNTTGLSMPDAAIHGGESDVDSDAESSDAASLVINQSAGFNKAVNVTDDPHFSIVISEDEDDDEDDNEDRREDGVDEKSIECSKKLPVVDATCQSTGAVLNGNSSVKLIRRSISLSTDHIEKRSIVRQLSLEKPVFIDISVSPDKMVSSCELWLCSKKDYQPTIFVDSDDNDSDEDVIISEKHENNSEIIDLLNDDVESMTSSSLNCAKNNLAASQSSSYSAKTVSSEEICDIVKEPSGIGQADDSSLDADVTREFSCCDDDEVLISSTPSSDVTTVDLNSSPDKLTCTPPVKSQSYCSHVKRLDFCATSLVDELSCGSASGEIGETADAVEGLNPVCNSSVCPLNALSSSMVRNGVLNTESTVSSYIVTGVERKDSENNLVRNYPTMGCVVVTSATDLQGRYVAENGGLVGVASNCAVVTASNSGSLFSDCSE